MFTFAGFPEASARHLLLDHDGYPTGAAWRFAAAVQAAPEPAAFLSTFLSHQRGAEPLASPDLAADADFHYHVQLRRGGHHPLQVQCWRRYPRGIGWQRRCGPMSLECFLRRFLPGS